MSQPTKKVLLMGRAGAGKTSMRSIIFANYLARDTKRLTATNNVEHSNLRFLGNLFLSLWDCGGQDMFMENYFESQREHIFRNAEVLIYVLEARGSSINHLNAQNRMFEVDKDFHYVKNALDNIKNYSPYAKIFCLIHKMDIVRHNERGSMIEYYRDELQRLSTGVAFTIFGTSIWDETLFKAWSEIVFSLVPHVDLLRDHLARFCEICHADEVVLFEKYTFLVISYATRKAHKDAHRFEKISNLCKQFKLTCGKTQSNFLGLILQRPSFTVFTERFTLNTYIMVIMSDFEVEPAATLCNIDYAREHFVKFAEEMPFGSTL